jgi:hypothetical protein
MLFVYKNKLKNGNFLQLTAKHSHIEDMGDAAEKKCEDGSAEKTNFSTCLCICILLILAFIIPSFAAENASSPRYKLYCMYTPDFSTLFNEYFLPSIKDDFELVAVEYPQDCPLGTFRSEGWEKTMLYKLELLQRAIIENWNDQIFFYADIDILFLEPILEEALACLGTNDFVVQQGWPRNGLCAGFFVMKGNEKTWKLITAAYDLLEKKICVDDQKAIELALENFRKEEISWDFLPSKQFANGRRVLKNSKELYSKDSLLELDPSILLFHANCCIGLENKYHFLERVEDAFFSMKNRILENFNIEDLPIYRTGQYSISPYKKIVIFSAPRTGSSLTYNIFRFLFEDNAQIFSRHDSFDANRIVLKTHKISEIDTLLGEPDILYIVTIRNLRDSAISHYRLFQQEICDNQSFAKYLVSKYEEYLSFFKLMEAAKSNIVYFKYEDFVDNIPYFFNVIEDLFSISLSQRDKELIKKGYSKENISSEIQGFSNFSEYLPISGFHGEHITPKFYYPPKDFLQSLDTDLKKLDPLLNQYGY